MEVPSTISLSSTATTATTTNTKNNGSPRHFRRRYSTHYHNVMDYSSQHPQQASFPRFRHMKKSTTFTKLLWGISMMMVMTTLSILVARNFGVVEVGVVSNTNNGRSSSSSSSSHIPISISSRRLGVKSAHVHVGGGPIQTIYISDSIRNELLKSLVTLRVDTSQLQDLNSFIQDAKEILMEHLDPTILTDLQQLHNTSSPISAIQFRNLPLDPYVPPTPTLPNVVSLNKPTYVAEALLVALGEMSGSGSHVVGYASEKEYSNPWIHEGFPRLSGTGGSALTKASELSFHQDMSYYTDPPDLLGLVCVREGHDQKVQTELMDIAELLETLPEAIVRVLRQERFQIKTSSWVDTTTTTTSNKKDNERRSILQGYSLSLPVDWENMIALDQPAQQALDMLQAAILEGSTTHYIHFVEGDLLLFSNVRVVHARTPYTDLRGDGGDRVMYRSYFKTDFGTAEQRRLRMI